MAAAQSTYSAYRQPKMRWLPSVPQHWNEQRAKTFFREVDERSLTGQEELLSVSHLTGVTPRSQKNVTMFKAASYVGSKLCRPGDIVINTLWAWMAALGASRHVGIVSPAYGVYRPHRADSFNPAYLDYLLRTRAYTAEYIGRSTGIRASRLRLYPNQFLDIALLQPPRTEQDQIVAYLRAQNAHIARFIKAKRDLIGLLIEQKLRIIDHAVTRGLNANVRLKPSGIEWLGEVPEHWGISRLKYCVSRIHSGGTPDTGVDSFWSDDHDGIPWLMIADVTKAERVDTSIKRLTQVGLASKRLTVVPSGAVLYTMYASIGKTAILGIDAAINQAILGLEPRRDALSSEFLFSWLRSMERHIKNMASTSTQANLNAAKVKALPIFIPPLDEQHHICDWIKIECLVFNEAIVRAEDEIKLIREYRDRLIADAVTGQVDLRGWQPGPDDAVSDDVLAALGDDDASSTDEETPDGEET
jgi:type I restriction enzyme S subunit